jgi:hypothetical protein
MEIFKIKHIDFAITISSFGFSKAFDKAKGRQSTFLESTIYSFDTGEATIFSPMENSLIELPSGKVWPVFFENADYFIDIDFINIDDASNPQIISNLKEIEDKFSYRGNHNLLSGTINYGNNIGSSEIKFKYKKNNELLEYNFAFEVFPTKLDYRNDYLKMVKDIEEAYPNLILDFLKKTHSNYSTEHGSSNDLIWWQIFGSLYNEFLKASQYILNKPHARLIEKTRYLKADRIKHLTQRQEEKIIEHRKTPSKLYRIDLKEQAVDTIENKFFKHALLETTNKYKRLKEYILYKYSYKISKDFILKLNTIENKLNIFVANPFLKNIGRFNGFRQESLLIQKGTGYSTIYKNWILLNSGLQFLEGIQKLEQKNIADLYEIWCFLEVKEIIQDIIKKDPTDIQLAQIEIDDFVFKFDKGVKSRISFTKDNGDLIELFHDYQFGKSTKDGLKSYTVNQRPDIVVKLTKNDLKEKYKFTYLYDAKYRLESDNNENSPDYPPDDAINQMHRYRDSIYYNKNKNSRPEKEIIGGYILFPGNGNLEQVKSHNFYKSIKHVNIGAFPLKPNEGHNKVLLKEHFKDVLELNSENILNNIIPQKELGYETVNPEVLIGFVGNKKHIAYFNSRSEQFYHTGIRKPSRFGYKDLKYFSPYIKGKGCKYYYDIIDYSILPRNKVFDKTHELYSTDTSERLVLHLGDKYIIKNEKYYKVENGIVNPYRYSKLSYLRDLTNNKIKAPAKDEE